MTVSSEGVLSETFETIKTAYFANRKVLVISEEPGTTIYHPIDYLTIAQTGGGGVVVDTVPYSADTDYAYPSAVF